MIKVEQVEIVKPDGSFLRYEINMPVIKSNGTTYFLGYEGNWKEYKQDKIVTSVHRKESLRQTQQAIIEQWVAIAELDFLDPIKVLAW